MGLHQRQLSSFNHHTAHFGQVSFVCFLIVHLLWWLWRLLTFHLIHVSERNMSHLLHNRYYYYWVPFLSFTDVSFLFIPNSALWDMWNEWRLVICAFQMRSSSHSLIVYQIPNLRYFYVNFDSKLILNSIYLYAESQLDWRLQLNR